MPEDLKNISPGDQLILDAFFELKEQQQFDRALRVLLALKDKYKQNAVILFLVGATQYELESFEQAVIHLREALNVAPTHALASLILIHSLAEQNKWRVAFEELRRFLSGKAKNRSEHIALLQELLEDIDNFSTDEKAAIKELARDFLR